MKISRKVLKYMIIVSAIFVLLIVFVLPNNLLQNRKIRRNIDKMKQEQVIHRENARRDSSFLENLKDDEFLEAYAREQFFMKRKGEEIYVIED